MTTPAYLQPRILTVKSMRKHVLLYGVYDVITEDDAGQSAKLGAAFASWTDSAKIPVNSCAKLPPATDT